MYLIDSSEYKLKRGNKSQGVDDVLFDLLSDENKQVELNQLWAVSFFFDQFSTFWNHTLIAHMWILWIHIIILGEMVKVITWKRFYALLLSLELWKTFVSSLQLRTLVDSFWIWYFSASCHRTIFTSLSVLVPILHFGHLRLGLM